MRNRYAALLAAGAFAAGVLVGPLTAKADDTIDFGKQIGEVIDLQGQLFESMKRMQDEIIQQSVKTNFDRLAIVRLEEKAGLEPSYDKKMIFERLAELKEDVRKRNAELSDERAAKAKAPAVTKP